MYCSRAAETTRPFADSSIDAAAWCARSPSRSCATCTRARTSRRRSFSPRGKTSASCAIRRAFCRGCGRSRAIRRMSGGANTRASSRTTRRSSPPSTRGRRPRTTRSRRKNSVLREVLDGIPDDAREVIVLYYRESRSTRQVAALLGISEAAARQRLSRSRALIREEVLERFGSAAAATAPGAAFTQAIALLVPAAPALSAGIAAKGAASASTLAKATAIGAVFGWIGVLLGMRALEPALDEREARQLRRFRNVVLVVVTLGCAAVAMSVSSAVRLLIALQSLYVIVAALYVIWLPRILRRRFESLHAVDPVNARAQRRRWLRSMIVPAVGAAIAGVLLMAVVLMLRG
ncbi:MAG: sigma-70 family RNA polymerase sigma factor [Acidobacteria bacterium]|nr:sigma-70 family RNA polymerase sigma factor [Acidobacteriota bacterium]MBV9478428.1 sigma-70 family RNA polymerase sigma factor [Acidobacteriota bacterium]